MDEIWVELKDHRYPIRIKPGLLNDHQLWESLTLGNPIVIVSNDTVAGLYLKRLVATFKDCNIFSITLPDGEQYKTWSSIERVVQGLADRRAGRNTTLIALGGGVVGDLTGFAAACYMRGITYIQVPTSLLAQVDAAVGGKTAINFEQSKNLVGAFHQPHAVLIDPEVLLTLSEREFRAGLAEVIKYAAINDAPLFARLEQTVDALLARELTVLSEIIARCCRNKAEIVMHDEKELGERALLNFGHSFGHALEAITGYTSLLHGEAVAIGMALAGKLSMQLGLATQKDVERLFVLLRRFGLPMHIPDAITPDQVLERMRLDKKNRDGKLRLVLWREPGKAEVVTGIEDKVIEQTLVNSRMS